jgi:hypothetical protein
VATVDQEDDLRDARSTLDSMLISGESVLALAAQRRVFALSHRRIMVAATSGRLIGLSRGLIGGFTPVDMRWQDLKSVQIKAGVLGSDLTITGLSQSDLASGGDILTLTFDGLRKENAQAVYRICQAQEQAWREKRRPRDLEEMRAQSGGFQSAPACRPIAEPHGADDADPLVRLPFGGLYGGVLRFRDRGAAHESRRTDWGIGGIEALAFGEDRPEDSRVLVDDGHQHSIPARPRTELNDPARQPVGSSMCTR